MDLIERFLSPLDEHCEQLKLETLASIPPGEFTAAVWDEEVIEAGGSQCRRLMLTMTGRRGRPSWSVAPMMLEAVACRRGREELFRSLRDHVAYVTAPPQG